MHFPERWSQSVVEKCYKGLIPPNLFVVVRFLHLEYKEISYLHKNKNSKLWKEFQYYMIIFSYYEHNHVISKLQHYWYVFKSQTATCKLPSNASNFASNDTGDESFKSAWCTLDFLLDKKTSSWMSDIDWDNIGRIVTSLQYWN